MAASRWIVGVIAMTGFGSMAFDMRPSNVQVSAALAAPAETQLCSGDNQATQDKATAPAANAGPSADSQAGTCPSDMVEVQGEHCQVVEQICEEYISEKKDRCAKYRNKVRCLGKTTDVHVCVDRYEYPNRMGEKPTVAVSYNEATELCAAEGKRLCTADEWTQACEGEEHLPYPYGYTRNSETCNHDKPYIIPNDQAYQDLRTRTAEIARLDQSEPSGARPDCVSPYGVYDMTGNVDEWVFNESGSIQGPEYDSGLKGGYWGPVRNRCRPMTTDHNRWHSGYQIGFRCCQDPSQGPKPAPIPRSRPETTPQAVESAKSVGRA